MLIVSKNGIKIEKMLFISPQSVALWIGKAVPGEKNSILLLFPILLTLSAINYLNEFDYPQIIQVEGTVTYRADGSPVDSAMVHMFQYVWEKDMDETDFQLYPYMESIAQTWTNKEGEYKIRQDLKDSEYCFGDIFGNIRAYKSGYLHKNWLKVKIRCTEELQNINFQIYEINSLIP